MLVVVVVVVVMVTSGVLVIHVLLVVVGLFLAWQNRGPPLNVNVGKSKMVCQALTVHRSLTLQFFSWQKRCETVTVQFAKHLTVDGERCTVGEH